MKLMYGKMLHTFAVSLFSLTLVGGLHADPADLTSHAKTLDAGAMQELATASTEMLTKIKALDEEADDSKKLESMFNLLQESHGKTFGTDVQEAFGRLVVKIFNDVTESHSYLQQVLQGIIDDKTPLLAPAQIEYVTKEMLPRVAPAAPATAQATEDTKEVVAKKPSKKKLKKKNKKAETVKIGKKKKGKKTVAEDEKDAVATGDMADVDKDAEKVEKKGKGKKRKKSNKNKKDDAKHEKDAIVTGDTTDIDKDAEKIEKKGKGKKRKKSNKNKKDDAKHENDTAATGSAL